MKSEAYHTEAASSTARWMVVDDTDDVRNVIALLLQRFGCAEVCCYRSGAEALAAFAATPDAFQFVVTDFEMPGMNGIELCQRLLSLSPHLKILLATGSSAVSPDFASQAGFCGMLNKPFPATALTRVLEAASIIHRNDDTEDQFVATESAFLTTA